MTDVFLGRQPIFDRQLRVFAYELLFRSSAKSVSAADIKSADDASMKVLEQTFQNIGLEAVVGDKRAFINVTRNFVLAETELLLPAQQVVIELLEDQLYDDALLQGMKRLKEQGFTIALDDFVYSEDLRELVDIADIIKLDVLALSQLALVEHFLQFKVRGIKMLAEKVESHEMLSFCYDLGFDLFQGYFLSRPQMLTRKQLDPSTKSVVELIALIQRDATSPATIENLLNETPHLRILLIDIINACFPIKTRVYSVQDAVIQLPLAEIKNWATMVVLSKMTHKPKEILMIGVLRAKTAQLAGPAFGIENVNPLFTAGMFSVFNAMIDEQLIDYKDKLPWDNFVKNALFNMQSEAYRLLQGVISVIENQRHQLLNEEEILAVKNVQAQAQLEAEKIIKVLFSKRLPHSQPEG